MVKVDRFYLASEALAVESKRMIGASLMVKKRLKEDFYNKFYICEMNELRMLLLSI